MSQSYEKKRPEPPTCPYNPGVVCRVQMFCKKCGWNPVVEKQAIFRLGQMDMRDSIAALLTDLADCTRGVVCSTLVYATTWVRQLEIP